MPTPGLSLVGFMGKPQAIRYMQIACVMPNPDIVALAAEWSAAGAKLGEPFPDAGHPDIQPIPSTSECQAYIEQMRHQPWIQNFLNAYPASSFKVVEIDPLLAWQFHISLEHSDGHYAPLSSEPGIAELLPIFLPQMPPQASIRRELTLTRDRQPGEGQSVLVAADTHNVRLIAQGVYNSTQGPVIPPGQAPLPPNTAGIVFGIGMPFVHVVRFNGRCYLINGLHRTLGARRRGAGRIPCFFREVSTPGEVGIMTDGSTFTLALLESPNPPTLGHFTQGRAHELPLRKVMRVLQVSWSQHLLPME
jgi:hypothetical protein